MIETTAFGAWFLPALLLVSVFRRDWLAGAIPVAAVLQAPAPLVVAIGGTRYGITPFNLVFVAVGLVLLLEHARNPRMAWEPLRQGTAWPWAVYLAYAVVAALVLPHVFGHVSVHPLLASGDVRFPATENRFSISHVAQAINHVGVLLLLVYIAAHRAPHSVLRALGWGFALAFVIALAAAAYQRAVFLGWHATDFAWWASNPGYNQWFHAPEYGPTFGRVGLPFIEPSYASVWFAGLLGGSWMLALYWRSRAAAWAVLGTALAALGLLNTVGTSGFAAMALFVPLIIARHVVIRPARTRRSNLMLVALVVTLLLALAFAVLDYLWWETQLGTPLRSAIWFTQQKTSNLAERPRWLTTLHAFQVFFESRGLGIGPGSTRTSGFLVSLLAHLGVPGLLLAAWATWRTLRALEPALAAPARLFALGMLYAGGLGLLIGIADLAWPVGWAWILFAVAVARVASRASAAGGHDILEGRASPAPAGRLSDPRSP